MTSPKQERWTAAKGAEYFRTGRDPRAAAAAPSPRTHNAPTLATSEADLHRSVVGWLELALPPSAGLFFHVPNERRSEVERLYLAGLGVIPGVYDFVFLLSGGTCAVIELKAGAGSLYTVQREFQRRCDELQIPNAVARSIADVERALRSWGVPLRTRRTA